LTSGLFARVQESTRLQEGLTFCEICRTAETHELAKRKAGEMDKIRAAFGLEEGVQEGQAFDRDLQERLKAERIAEKETRQLAKLKEEEKRKKDAKKEEKKRKKEEKKKVKEAKKAAALKEKVNSSMLSTPSESKMLADRR
jgi:hypothetical protein